jgi:hypothetical protein
MRNGILKFGGIAIVTTALGCGASPPAAPPTAQAQGEAGHDHGHAHAHASHGPHGGEIIELGNEQYHAELVHDDSSVVIYLLDSSAKTGVPIESKELTINLKGEGQPRQFKLAAVPEPGDPAGAASKFASSDPQLARWICDEQAEPKLVLEINGTAYRGSLAHDHDHAHPH